jgi:hypothetical protein
VGIAATVNGISSVDNGGDFFDGAGQAAVMGAISAIVSYGVGSVFKEVGSLSKELARATAHAATSGGLSVLQGGNFWHGAASGAVSSLAGSAADGTTTGVQIGASAIAGGLTSEIVGGDFWYGLIQGGAIAGFNHGLHRVLSEPPGKVKVYIETDGVGHVYIEVEGIIYSFGRYEGSDSPSMGAYGITGDGVLLKEKANYAKVRMAKYPTKVIELSGVNTKALLKYFAKNYEGGLPSKKNESGRVTSKYKLFSNNCSTTVCNALQSVGYNIPTITTPDGWLHWQFRISYYRPIY